MPLNNSFQFSYSLSFAFLHFSLSSYLLLVDNVTHQLETFIFNNTKASGIYNITIGLSYCPSTIKSTFILGMSHYVICYIWWQLTKHVFFVGCPIINMQGILHYRISTFGIMSVQLSGDNSTIQCHNRTWEKSLSDMEQRPSLCKKYLASSIPHLYLHICYQQ